ncbi:hypothetical protein FHG87_012830 [Trinorchestia longiramus]|nr:hypothetical protein FHG87_012830 [Trinorchestia longiramus]
MPCKQNQPRQNKHTEQTRMIVSRSEGVRCDPPPLAAALSKFPTTFLGRVEQAPTLGQYLAAERETVFILSLSGSSPGAVASVAGTSVGITSSYPQKFSDPNQTKQVLDPSGSQTSPCSNPSQKSTTEISTESSSKYQPLSAANSAVYSSGQSNSRASSEHASLSPRSLSSDYDGPSEHSIFTSSNGQNDRSDISSSNYCNDRFNVFTSNESNSGSNNTGRFQDSSDVIFPHEYGESSTFSPRGYTEALSDGRLEDPSCSVPSVGLTALGVSASEDRDSLMWCSDADFDAAVSSLSMKGLIELVQSLQDAMVVEQQTFDTLTLQLETTRDPVVQQRLSAALCTSQTRLARLCARNMRCFSQQSLKARHKDSSPQQALASHHTSSRPSNVSKTTITHTNTDNGLNNSALDFNFGQNAAYDSRAASPRDSGLAVSSTNGSDGEEFKSTSGSPSPPPSVSGAAFKNSLAFFQKAAHLVVNNAKNAQTGARQKESRRRRSGTSSSGVDSAYSDSASEDLHSRSLDRKGERRPRFSGAPGHEGRPHQTAGRTRSLGREGPAGAPEVGQMSSDEGSFLGSAELPSDAGTYEQVLFINGRPQYQDDFRRSQSCESLDSWTNNSASSPSSTTTVKINLSSSGIPHRNQKPQKNKHYNNIPFPSRQSSSTSPSTISSDGGWTRVVLDGTNSKNNSSSTTKKNGLNSYSCSSSKRNVTDNPTAPAVKCRSSSSSSASSGGNCRPSADLCSSLTSGGSWAGGGGGSVRKSDSDYALGYSSSATSDSASISVTLPRRKPYLNLQSVTTGNGSSVVNIYSSGGGGGGTGVSVSARREVDVSPCREFLPKVCGVNIQRSQSFKEGLDDTKSGFPVRSYPLTRTQSYNEGLSGELEDFNRPSLSRAPSIDEILESVRNLRVKKNMVKSTPDLYQNIGESVYHSASMPRHKSSSKSKSSRSAGASGIIGVRYSSKSTEHVYDRVPEPHYEQIIEDGDPYYENIHKETSYENINHKSRKEVIYDRPKSNKAVESKYDQVPGDLLYENVSNYDLSVYENIADSEPTYMNVSNSNSSSRSKKSRSSKETSRSKSKPSNNLDLAGGQTYDIPRSATHIYDTPKKYSRSVSSSEDFSEYATPKNNRSVTPSSLDSIQLAKQDQKKKIDDIFAEVDVYDDDDDDRPDDRHHPGIPPPGRSP